MPKIRFFHPSEETPTQKPIYRLTNWPDYNRALIERGALTLWLNEQTLADWYHTGPRLPGGVYRYSDACIRCALSFKAILGLAFRQTQGLIHSLLETMKLDLQTPSYTQLCRRQASLTKAFESPQPQSTNGEPLHLVVDSTGLKVYGEGEWKVRKHGASKRRTWRKLHLAIDEASGQIHAVELTTNAITDAVMLPPLLAAISQPISKVGADGAYDQIKVYEAVAEGQIMPLIPPRVNAVLWLDKSGKALMHPRNEAIKRIDEVGLAAWKQQSGYHRRSLAETGMFRWKTIFGPRLVTRLLAHQQVEAQIKASCLNRLTQLGMPRTVRCNST